MNLKTTFLTSIFCFAFSWTLAQNFQVEQGQTISIPGPIDQAVDSIPPTLPPPFRTNSAAPCGSKVNNHWRFGNNAGLDFNSGSPVTLYSSSMRAFESSAAISDKNGDLLFYTNGGSIGSQTNYTGGIWNRNNQLMPNGALGANDIGCTSSTTSALIIGDPGDTSRYYVFVLSCTEEQHSPGFAYHVVDMDLDNGLGDVAIKNSFLGYIKTETMAGIRHCNGSDAWIITGNEVTNSLDSYLITSNGVNASPIASLPFNSNLLARRTQFSPDGRKLLCAFYQLNTNKMVTHLYDFDPATGALSFVANLQTIPLDLVSDVAFSPNARFGYVYGYNFSTNISFVSQFDLDTAQPGTAPFTQSDTLGPSGGIPCGMDCGPDGKIYLALSNKNSINAINNPNQAQAPVQDSAVISRFPYQGLISVMQEITIHPAPEISGQTMLCSGDQSSFDLQFDPCGNKTILWEYHGAGSLVSAVDSQAVILAGTPGTDTLIANMIGACNTLSDTFLMQVSLRLSPDLGADTTFCDSIVLDPGVGFVSYTWQDNSTDSTLTVFQPGTYYVETVGPCGNLEIDSITVASCPVGLQNAELLAELTIAPNPNQGAFRVNVEFFEWVDQMELIVRDAMGRQLVQRNMTVAGNAFSKTFLLEHLPNGLYVFQLSYGNETLRKTFLIRN